MKAMHEDKKENPPKTFAEILKEHTRLCRETMQKGRAILEDAQKATGAESKIHLAKLAGGYFDAVNDANIIFERKFGRELETLQAYLENKSRQ